MKTQFQFGVAFAALMVPGAAFAQSTGSIEVEEEIVVTATRSSDGVGGVVSPDATKPRAVLTEELIGRQGAGQSILNTINQVPGVNFTQSDAYGSSGGNLRIRGFDGNRISLTFDGFPLNDTGNYAIFSNQQLDPELIYSVNVNLGTTDVDSPTASAAGGTVNYLTRTPGNDIGATLVASYGEDDYHRIFGMIDTGEITSFGTKMFFAASTARNDKFKGPGEIYKQQYNARIYQPVGDNGDFLSLAGHYNQNRNNFYRNPTIADLRTLTGRPNMVDVDGFSKAQQTAIFGFDNDAVCVRPTPVAGVAQNEGAGASAACNNYFGLRINPSNTGNARFNSRFTFADNLKFTMDASFQYVLANGGGTTTRRENDATFRGSSATSLGVDLNGDGDVLDTVRFYTPNTTNTRRLTVISSLIWDLTDEHRFRLAYTYDRGRHRQTGEWGFLGPDGRPENVFGGRNGRPVLAADGALLRQRDRLSIALLNQISGQYIGKFFEDRLRIEAGVRMPFFKRDLNQFCPSQAGGQGFAVCTSQPLGTTAAANTTYIVPANFVVTPTTLGTPVYAPFKAQYKYSPVLPSLGLNFKITDDLAMFASYAKGFSSPRTDNLYRQPFVDVAPETTNTFDAGLRYTTSKAQIQATAWYTKFRNRIVTSFDQDAGISVDRNVGSVKGKGFDIGVAIRPLSFFTFQGNLSYNDSKLQDDLQVGVFTPAGSTTPQPLFIPTAGKRVTETPEWTVGYRAAVEFGPVQAGLQVKYVSDRFATDLNDIKSGSYTTADFDARLSFKQWGLDKTWLQLNVYNLFDRFYFGNIGTQVSGTNNVGLVRVPNLAAGAAIPGGVNPNFSVGAPRTISATLRVGF
jgi:iron complex outermembrane recepter protein